jgi:hypothetical protein
MRSNNEGLSTSTGQRDTEPGMRVQNIWLQSIHQLSQAAPRHRINNRRREGSGRINVREKPGCQGGDNMWGDPRRTQRRLRRQRGDVDVVSAFGQGPRQVLDVAFQAAANRRQEVGDHQDSHGCTASTT